jgi:3-hydroxyacyl-[acyl-carrier-protein] dehydratase
MREFDAVDQVVDIVAGQRGTGIRNVPATLEVFDSHFPRFPVLPGVLVLGSLVELARRVCVAADPEGHWRLARASRMQYRRFVRPGDQLELSVDLRHRLPGGGRVFSAEVRVDGVVVTRAREIHLVPAS